MSLTNRTKTMSSEDDSISGEDTSETTKLFQDRLTAWRSACGYLSDYVSTTEKMQHAHAKEYEKVLKTVTHPIKEGDHFSQTLGGMVEMFEGIKSNTQSISNSHGETAKNLKTVVLPIFERLETEIKTKQKELKKGAGKGSKVVDKSRATTQKQVDLLNQHTSSFGSVGKHDPSTDPYILQKGVYHRLNKQIDDENSTRSDMISVQDSFAQFEAHIVQTIQQGMGSFYQTVGGQADQQKHFYQSMVQTTQKQNPLFEWNGFVQRRGDVLIDSSAAPRTLETSTFANQNHHSTKAMVEGPLERKQGLLKKWDSSFYAITTSKYMHEFKTDDNLANDPKPEMSLYLPDVTVGALNGNMFSVKGKDLTSKLSLHSSKEYEFRARSTEDAETWYGVIKGVIGMPGESNVPMSPVSDQKEFGQSRASYDSNPTTAYSQSSTAAQDYSHNGTLHQAEAGAEKRFAYDDPVASDAPRY